MYTEPQIVAINDLSKRAYVTFYLDDKRIREYNGNSIGIRLSPNRATNIEERNNLLKQLRFELHKALDAGSYGLKVIKAANDGIEPTTTNKAPVKQVSSASVVLAEALNAKLKVNLSKKYKRNLNVIHKQFTAFLTDEELNSRLQDISTKRLNEFLSAFGSSGTYYMNKRRDLAVLYSAAGAILDTSITIKSTERRRVTASLHTPYDRVQLKPLLQYLKLEHPKMYLCCLLTYACWLRPHEEVRLLTKQNFKKDNTEIHLAGESNKSGRVRVVYVPNYVQAELTAILNKLELTDNIFSSFNVPHNESYFSTQWGRAFDKMAKLNLIRKNQTIYSFRHTAAIQAYRKSKDVYLIQKLLGHSTILVTLKYLRSLGELNSEDLINAAPTLD